KVEKNRSFSFNTRMASSSSDDQPAQLPLRITERGPSCPALTRDFKMKHLLVLLVISIACFSTTHAQSVSSQNATHDANPEVTNDVVHVSTAFEHLTVLEFAEPVAMAAAGSNAFQIERQSNKVFIKPLRQGVATDLFVWTQSRRFTYELDAPGEVKNMTFAIDNPVPVLKPVPDTHEQMARIADMMLTKAFLESERIDSSSIRDAKHSLSIRVEQVFESSNSLYVYYSIVNRTTAAYHLSLPTAYQILPLKSNLSIHALANKQLSNSSAHKLGEV